MRWARKNIEPSVLATSSGKGQALGTLTVGGATGRNFSQPLIEQSHKIILFTLFLKCFDIYGPELAVVLGQITLPECILERLRASCKYRYISFYRTSQILCFLQIEDLWQPCVKQIYRCHFPNNICSRRVCVLYFGNSHSISNFFIIPITVI